MRRADTVVIYVTYIVEVFNSSPDLGQPCFI